MNNLLEHNESLQIIRIQKSNSGEVLFSVDGKEICYGGKMYDVKERSTDGDSIVLSCIADEIETGLLENLDNNVQNNIATKSSSDKKQNNIYKITLNDYCVNTNRDSLPRPFRNAVFDPSILPIRSFVVSISSPPPKVSFS
jgi:hypothetical protein